MEKLVLIGCLAAAVLLNPAYALDSGVSADIVAAIFNR